MEDFLIRKNDFCYGIQINKSPIRVLWKKKMSIQEYENISHVTKADFDNPAISNKILVAIIKYDDKNN